MLAQFIEDVLVVDQDGGDRLGFRLAIAEHLLQAIDFAVDQRRDGGELCTHPFITNVAIEPAQGRFDQGLGFQITRQEILPTCQQITAHAGGGLGE
ncbi:hypothetical protein D3C87_1630310 [compost metagenome]